MMSLVWPFPFSLSTRKLRTFACGATPDMAPTSLVS